MKNTIAVFKREFRAYFDSPVAYVFLTAFLVLAGFLTFGVAMFYERRQADLAPFFFWHPWVYLLLVPAATMGLWADERRNGTAELLLTLPVTVFEVLVGKFLAAWSFVGIGLALTFPVALTAGYLGSPDWGAVFCGYLGSFLLAGAAVAIGVFASTLSRSSVVGFVVSLALVGGRVRRLARSRRPAPHHRVRPGDRRGRLVGRSDGDNGRGRVVLAPVALRVDA